MMTCALLLAVHCSLSSSKLSETISYPFLLDDVGYYRVNQVPADKTPGSYAEFVSTNSWRLGDYSTASVFMLFEGFMERVVSTSTSDYDEYPQGWDPADYGPAPHPYPWQCNDILFDLAKNATNHTAGCDPLFAFEPEVPKRKVSTTRLTQYRNLSNLAAVLAAQSPGVDLTRMLYWKRPVMTKAWYFPRPLEWSSTAFEDLVISSRTPGDLPEFGWSQIEDTGLSLADWGTVALCWRNLESGGLMDWTQPDAETIPFRMFSKVIFEIPPFTRTSVSDPLWYDYYVPRTFTLGGFDTYSVISNQFDAVREDESELEFPAIFNTGGSFRGREFEDGIRRFLDRTGRDSVTVRITSLHGSAWFDDSSVSCGVEASGVCDDESETVVGGWIYYRPEYPNVPGAVTGVRYIPSSTNSYASFTYSRGGAVSGPLVGRCLGTFVASVVQTNRLCKVDRLVAAGMGPMTSRLERDIVAGAGQALSTLDKTYSHFDYAWTNKTNILSGDGLIEVHGNAADFVVEFDSYVAGGEWGGHLEGRPVSAVGPYMANPEVYGPSYTPFVRDGPDLVGEITFSESWTESEFMLGCDVECAIEPIGGSVDYDTIHYEIEFLVGGFPVNTSGSLYLQPVRAGITPLLSGNVLMQWWFDTTSRSGELGLPVGDVPLSEMSFRLSVNETYMRHASSLLPVKHEYYGETERFINDPDGWNIPDHRLGPGVDYEKRIRKMLGWHLACCATDVRGPYSQPIYADEDDLSSPVRWDSDGRTCGIFFKSFVNEAFYSKWDISAFLGTEVYSDIYERCRTACPNAEAPWNNIPMTYGDLADINGNLSFEPGQFTCTLEPDVNSVIRVDFIKDGPTVAITGIYFSSDLVEQHELFPGDVAPIARYVYTGSGDLSSSGELTCEESRGRKASGRMDTYSVIDWEFKKLKRTKEQ